MEFAVEAQKLLGVSLEGSLTTSREHFHGRILVQPRAQKTDAKQTNKNLLLSNEATVDTKPQLECRTM